MGCQEIFWCRVSKSNFVVTAVGVTSCSLHQNTNIFILIVAFYPKDGARTGDLKRLIKVTFINIISVQGRFSISKIKVDK